jgi:hypothetical protein
MRVLSPASSAVLAGAFLSGCFSSSSAGPPAQEGPEDSGPQPAVDATTVPEATTPVLDATKPVEEASLPEAAAPIEAGPSPVTVTIVNHLGPEEGVYIVFQDVNGDVVSAATTNAAGQVIQLLGAATQVTALTGSSPQLTEVLALRRGVAEAGSDAEAEGDGGVEEIPSPSNVNLVTVQGVEPGDNLSLVDPSDTTYSSAQVSVDSVPEGAPPATQGYSVRIGACPNYDSTFTVPPFTVGLTADCESNGTFPVLVVAQGGPDAGNGPLGYTWQNGNTIPLDGGVAHVAMTGTWETATTTQTVTADNAPGSGNAYAAFSEVANNVATSSPTATYLAEALDGSATAVFSGHPGFPTAVQSEVSLRQSQGFVSGTAIAVNGPFQPDAGTTLDLSTALPLINWVVQDAGFAAPDAAASSAQPFAAWGSDAGSLASVSGVVVQFSWDDYAGSAGTQQSGTWTIVAPPTATNVTAPLLPPQLATWGVGPSANLYYVPTIVAVQASGAPTYGVFRTQYARLPVTNAFLGYNSGALVPALPAAGTLKLTAVTENSD